MKKILIALCLLCAATSPVVAQIDYNNGYNSIDENGTLTTADRRNGRQDSLHSDKEIPKGVHVWTIDERFGDRTKAEVDTMPHMYMNSVFTTGLRGEYNSTGNLGAPRINRVFADRPEERQFMFLSPFDYFVRPVSTHHFTNTYSPITNITFNSAGDRTNGEDDFKAIFAVNAGRRLGVGFRFDYKYGRGYYTNQATSHFGYTMWGSYLGDRYQAHLLLSTNHQKVTENDGITNDYYITHPESFNESFSTDEIPTVLSQNWNRNDNQHVFLSHRYSVGFNRKVPMTQEEIKAKKFAMEAKKEEEERKRKEKEQNRSKREGRNFDEKGSARRQTFGGRPDGAKIAGDEPADSISGANGRIAVGGKAAADSLIAKAAKEKEDTSWLKNEYVPVTSFIHTVQLDNYRRIYQAYATPTNYYLNDYYANTGIARGDSIFDKTRHYELRNTLAIALLEGFNKWAKSGIKLFATHDLRHFELPDSTGGVSKYNEHSVSVGGQLTKAQGQTFHYNVTAEVGVAGEDAGTLRVDGNADLNFPLLGDTVQLAATGFFHRLNPTFYYRHYHARHLWWDNSLDKVIHTRLQGIFTLKKTQTQLRVAVDELKNYSYFSRSYNVSSTYARSGTTVTPVQTGEPINLITVSLSQNMKFGPVHWESVLTYQKSSKQDVIPVPALNAYTNIFLRFKIARVLATDLGADMRYFTRYYAPDYSPQLGVYTVQGNTDTRVQIGNYPLINVYANFHLKHTRFFVMYSHVNSGSGNKEYFFVPHYPLNEGIFRFGVSWNFFN